mmetsp:Transcript_111505/g.314842  ORF Transcript_111505/g.314842 Transcript_111505/m.314842 type:complete len:260 (+) Transcript_111505:988-1767(+)
MSSFSHRAITRYSASSSSSGSSPPGLAGPYMNTSGSNTARRFCCIAGAVVCSIRTCPDKQRATPWPVALGSLTVNARSSSSGGGGGDAGAAAPRPSALRYATHSASRQSNLSFMCVHTGPPDNGPSGSLPSNVKPTHRGNEPQRCFAASTVSNSGSPRSPPAGIAQPGKTLHSRSAVASRLLARQASPLAPAEQIDSSSESGKTILAGSMLCAAAPKLPPKRATAVIAKVPRPRALRAGASMARLLLRTSVAASRALSA